MTKPKNDSLSSFFFCKKERPHCILISRLTSRFCQTRHPSLGFVFQNHDLRDEVRINIQDTTFDSQQHHFLSEILTLSKLI